MSGSYVLQMASQVRNVFGAFEKRTPGEVCVQAISSATNCWVMFNNHMRWISGRLSDVYIFVHWWSCMNSFAAEEVLAQLTDQLNRRKAQLQDAGDKLARIQQAINDQVQFFTATTCVRKYVS